MDGVPLAACGRRRADGTSTSTRRLSEDRSCVTGRSRSYRCAMLAACARLDPRQPCDARRARSGSQLESGPAERHLVSSTSSRACLPRLRRRLRLDCGSWRRCSDRTLCVHASRSYRRRAQVAARRRRVPRDRAPHVAAPCSTSDMHCVSSASTSRTVDSRRGPRSRGPRVPRWNRRAECRRSNRGGQARPAARRCRAEGRTVRSTWMSRPAVAGHSSPQLTGHTALTTRMYRSAQSSHALQGVPPLEHGRVTP